MSVSRDDLDFASYMGRMRLLSKIELDNNDLIQERLKAIDNPNRFVIFRTEEEASRFHKLSMPAYLIYIEETLEHRVVRVKFDDGSDDILCWIGL